MKVFHSEGALLNLPLFGIQIPMTDGRVLKVKDFLEKKGHDLSSVPGDISLNREDFARAHAAEYVSRLFGTKEELRKAISDTFEIINEKGEYHRYDPAQAQYPLEELFGRFVMQTKGTMAAVDEALKAGESFFLGGGFHHAMSFGGRGFCLINDIIIAARWAQAKKRAKEVWVIDVDAHKGDGTAEIVHNDPTIKTMSIHMKEGWPLDSAKTDEKGDVHPWFIESDVEIGVAHGEEGEYLKKLQAGLHQLEGLSQKKPSLAIVVQGSDPYEKDQLPSSQLLQLTKEQMLDRDLMVYRFLRERDIPQAYVMSGGYGEHAYEIYCQFLAAILV